MWPARISAELLQKVPVAPADTAGCAGTAAACRASRPGRQPPPLSNTQPRAPLKRAVQQHAPLQVAARMCPGRALASKADTQVRKLSVADPRRSAPGCTHEAAATRATWRPSTRALAGQQRESSCTSRPCDICLEMRACEQALLARARFGAARTRCGPRQRRATACAAGGAGAIADQLPAAAGAFADAQALVEDVLQVQLESTHRSACSASSARS